MNIFSPFSDMKSIWEQYARETGAVYEAGGLLKSPKLIKKYKNWSMEMSARIENTNNGPDDNMPSRTILETLIHVPFVSTSDFTFEIAPENVAIKILKKLGRKDIQIGVPEFDQKFNIRGDNPDQVIAFLQDQALRDTILRTGTPSLHIDENKKLFGRGHGKETQILEYFGYGLADSIGRIQALFELMEKTMDQLQQIGKAADEPVEE
jgi:hypothetical protein